MVDIVVGQIGHYQIIVLVFVSFLKEVENHLAIRHAVPPQVWILYAKYITDTKCLKYENLSWLADKRGLFMAYVELRVSTSNAKLARDIDINYTTNIRTIVFRKSYNPCPTARPA